MLLRQPDLMELNFVNHSTGVTSAIYNVIYIIYVHQLISMYSCRIQQLIKILTILTMDGAGSVYSLLFRISLFEKA